jgi:hypothetical protein
VDYEEYRYKTTRALGGVMSTCAILATALGSAAGGAPDMGIAALTLGMTAINAFIWMIIINS